MAIAFGASGAAAAGTTSLSVPYPTGITAGQMLVLAIATKSGTIPIVPTDWTIRATDTGGAGSGVDQGQITAFILTKEADGFESGNLSVSLPSGNSSLGRMFRYTKAAGKTWSFASATAQRNVGGSTSWSVTTAGTLDATANDMIIAASAVNTDAYSFSGQDLSASGITAWGTYAERQDSGTTNGNDCRLVVSEHPITAGTATGALTHTMLANGSATNAPAGASAFLRLREVDPPSVTIAGTFPMAASLIGGLVPGVDIAGTFPASAVLAGSIAQDRVIAGTFPAVASLVGDLVVPVVGVEIAGTFLLAAGLAGGEAVAWMPPEIRGTFAMAALVVSDEGGFFATAPAAANVVIAGVMPAELELGGPGLEPSAFESRGSMFPTGLGGQPAILVEFTAGLLPPTPSLAVSTASGTTDLAAGDYQAKLTAVDAEGGETTLSETAFTFTVAPGELATLTLTSSAGCPTATGFRLYLAPGGSDAFRRYADLPPFGSVKLTHAAGLGAAPPTENTTHGPAPVALLPPMWYRPNATGRRLYLRRKTVPTGTLETEAWRLYMTNVTADEVELVAPYPDTVTPPQSTNTTKRNIPRVTIPAFPGGVTEAQVGLVAGPDGFSVTNCDDLPIREVAIRANATPFDLTTRWEDGTLWEVCENLNNPSHRITVTKTGVPTIVRDVRLRCRPETVITMKPAGGGIVCVKDCNGYPLPGATVTVSGFDPVVTSAGSPLAGLAGCATIPGAIGSHSVTVTPPASSPGYSSKTQTLVLSSTTPVTVTLDADSASRVCPFCKPGELGPTRTVAKSRTLTYLGQNITLTYDAGASSSQVHVWAGTITIPTLRVASWTLRFGWQWCCIRSGTGATLPVKVRQYGFWPLVNATYPQGSWWLTVEFPRCHVINPGCPGNTGDNAFDVLDGTAVSQGAIEVRDANNPRAGCTNNNPILFDFVNNPLTGLPWDPAYPQWARDVAIFWEP